MSRRSEASGRGREAADRSRYERLLGESIVVADPRITGVQAAQVLGITSAQVRILVTRGRLPRYGERRKTRQFRLSDVKGLESPITVHQAGEIWACGDDEAQEVIARGAFVDTGDEQRPIRRVDAYLEQGRCRTRPGPTHRERPVVDRSRWSRKRRQTNGWIGTSDGAEILGVASSYARRLAVEGRLPAEQDAFGRWWFEADRVKLIADGRALRRQLGSSTSKWPFAGRGA